MSWYSRCSWCGGPFNGGNCRHCTNASFEDVPVYDSNPNSYNQTPEFSYLPSQPQTSSFDQFYCFGCGDPLKEGARCQRCTCKWCGYGLGEGSCWFCASRDGNSSIDVPNPNSFNDTPNVFTHPPQPQYESNSCELCGNDYGYDCPPRFSLYSIDHQEDLNQQRISDVHDRWDKLNESQNELLNMMKSFCKMVIQKKQAANIGQSPPQEMSIQDIEDLKQQYLDEMKSMINQIQIEDYRNERIDIHYRREWQAAKLSTYTTEPSRRFNIIYDDDNDDKESIIPLNEIIYQIPPSIAITPVLPIEDPEDSLIMGNEELSTIPEKESDEVIKSSVKDFISIPSESEDTSGSDSECDLPTSSDVNPLFDEVLGDIKDSYASNLDEPDLLVTPFFDSNEDDCFNPGYDIDEIELLLYHDLSTLKMSVASILEGFTNEPPLEENDDLFDLESKENEWKKILYDAPIDDLMTKDKETDMIKRDKFEQKRTKSGTKREA
nr:hypothetical protein [Tanacetum cinerariifolium]